MSRPPATRSSPSAGRKPHRPERRSAGPATQPRVSPPRIEPKLPRPALLVALLSAVISFAVYLATLSPSVAGGDSGEFIVVAHVMGVTHPPGFPLYVILAKLFTLLPLGSVAWRVNLLSAVSAAGAAFLLCLAVSRWSGSIWGGILAAGTFAFSPLVWPTAVVAEVFALNCMFAAGLIALSVWAAAEPERRHWLLPLSMFWLGLGLSNHPTLVFFGAPFGIFVLYLGRHRLGDPRFLLALVGAFALGLLPYLYLPIASAAHPPVTWGDQSTVQGFLTHVLRREYGTFRLSAHNTGSGSGFVLTRLGSFVEGIGSMTFWIGPLLFLAGLLTLGRANSVRSVAVLWLGALLVYLFGFNALSNLGMEKAVQSTIQERFWQQALVVVAAMMGVGLVEIGRRLRPAWSRPLEPVVAIGLPAVLIAMNFSAMNHRHDHLIDDYGRAILDSLPHDSLLLIEGDTSLGIVRYLQQADGMRRDVRVIPTGLLQTPWLRRWVSRDLPGVTMPPKREAPDAPETYSYQELIEANLGRFPIFLINQQARLKTMKEGYNAWPMGLTEQLLPNTQQPNLRNWVATQEKALDHFDAAAAIRLSPTTYEWALGSTAWSNYQNFGFDLALVAPSYGNDPPALRVIIGALERLAHRHPSPSPRVYKNLGVAYQALAKSDPAAWPHVAENWRRYLATNPTDDPDLPAIHSFVDRTPAGTH